MVYLSAAIRTGLCQHFPDFERSDFGLSVYSQRLKSERPKSERLLVGILDIRAVQFEIFTLS